MGKYNTLRLTLTIVRITSSKQSLYVISHDWTTQRAGHCKGGRGREKLGVRGICIPRLNSYDREFLIDIVVSTGYI